MSLSNLIRRKNEPVGFATATPATFATLEREKGRAVASVATVAVAKSPQGQTAHPAKVSPGDTATASRWWLIHYPDRDPLEVACCPDATHAEILERHPDAVAAEPFTPTIRQPSAPLTVEAETAIRAWLALIEETDPATIAEVLTACRRDPEARVYFLSRAADAAQQRCANCQHVRRLGGVVRYCASGRPDLLPAYGEGHPLRQLPADGGVGCPRWATINGQAKCIAR